MCFLSLQPKIEFGVRNPIHFYEFKWFNFVLDCGHRGFRCVKIDYLIKLINTSVFTKQIEVGRMIIYCNPSLAAQETCCELSENMVS